MMNFLTFAFADKAITAGQTKHVVADTAASLNVNLLASCTRPSKSPLLFLSPVQKLETYNTFQSVCVYMLGHRRLHDCIGMLPGKRGCNELSLGGKEGRERERKKTKKKS